MDAQVLQSVGTREQISFLPHDGHSSGLSSHMTQRLKTVRSVRSTSDLRLTDRRVTGMEEDMAV